MKKYKSIKGITLIALVITIIILLILAGISISQLTGSGLFEKARAAEEKSKIADGLEKLKMIAFQAQITTAGKATLEDFVEELKTDRETYAIRLGEVATITGEIPNIEGKDYIIVTYKGYDYKVDRYLEIIYYGENGTIYYNITKDLSENLEIDNKDEIIAKDESYSATVTAKPGYEIDTLTVTMGGEQVNIDKTTGIINIENVTGNIVITGTEKGYYSITKTLSQNLVINNNDVRVEKNKSYSATVTAKTGYEIDTLTVTMGGEQVNVDKTTGIINIGNVIGDIVITGTEKELTYTITYNANGGTGAPTDTNKYKRGAEISINFTTVPTKTGFRFKGYSTTQNATSATYTSTGTKKIVMGNSNITLYAVWEEKGIDAAGVAAAPTTYYGETITYSSGNVSDWKIFYSDGTNIYITTSDIVTKTPLSAYASSRDAAVTYLRTPTNWTTYAQGTGAKEAYGAITYEMFKASYNAVGGNLKLAIDSSGYVTWDYNSVFLNYGKGMYVLDSYYWLASPVANQYSDVVYVYLNGTGNIGTRVYSADNVGVRPLVCLKSGVELKKVNGSYTINVVN